MRWAYPLTQRALMELGLTVPALLFPAISLLYLSYNGRFLALASLIRALHREWEDKHEDSVYDQIQNLRTRLRLIRNMQLCGALSFILAAGSMTLLFWGMNAAGEMAFGAALIMLLASVVLLLRENAISVRALELQLASVKRGR